jgi:hypothetical protein
MQGLLPGSVSKYCLQQSPIPVIVVRPSVKREKKKKKRLADPNRRSYNHILQLSEKRGSGLFDPAVSSESNIDKLPAEEAAAVAEAVGLPRRFRHNLSDSKLSSLSKEGKELSSKGNDEHEHDGAADPLKSPASVDTENAVVLKSPIPGDLDSPSESESEDDADDIRGRRDNTETSPTTTTAASPEEPESSSAQEQSTPVTIPEVATSDIEPSVAPEGSSGPSRDGSEEGKG